MYLKELYFLQCFFDFFLKIVVFQNHDSLPQSPWNKNNNKTGHFLEKRKMTVKFKKSKRSNGKGLLQEKQSIIFATLDNQEIEKTPSF